MAGTVEFEWSGGQSPASLADDLEALEDAVDKHLVEALETWALLVESTAKSLAPVESGRLRSSIASETKQNGSTITSYVGSNVSYAPEIEYGRDSIQADSGFLRFKIDGEVFYRREVDAAPAQPFLRPAIDAHLSDIQPLMKKALEKAVAEAT